MSKGQQKKSLSLSQRIAEFARKTELKGIPTDVVEKAKIHLVDASGTALAASQKDFSKPLISAMTELGGSGDTPIFGHIKKSTLRDATLVNGALIHSLDFDDTHGESVVHCSASAWPTAFGIGLDNNLSGADALVGYLIAAEVSACIGSFTGGTLQRKGFHPTGIIGAFGCAAGAGRLYGLRADQIVDALGITLSMASGNMEFVTDGAWTKRLHPGWAAVIGITAAILAKNGFKGPTKPLEGQFGLFATLLEDINKSQIAALGKDLGEKWRVREFAIKPYPLCHFNHSLIDCALKIRRKHKFQLHEVSRITVLLHPDELPIVCEPLHQKKEPKTIYEAQFSAPYAVATALLRGRFGISELEDRCLTDKDIIGLAKKVIYAKDPKSGFPKYFSGGVKLQLTSGQVVEEYQRIHQGAPEYPLSDESVMEKFFANSKSSLGDALSELLANSLMHLENLQNLEDLADLIRGLSRSSG
mgnify:CR=1 FL=1